MIVALLLASAQPAWVAVGPGMTKDRIYGVAVAATKGDRKAIADARAVAELQSRLLRIVREACVDAGEPRESLDARVRELVRKPSAFWVDEKVGATYSYVSVSVKELMVWITNEAVSARIPAVVARIVEEERRARVAAERKKTPQPVIDIH